ncbi:MAG: peptidylprolyl isomerase [Planctomycetota bacterium]|nr:peptidylprolyl isomerase [Planctomycetota bacterium]
MTAATGSRVRIHYTGRHASGETFDSSYERGEPLEFTAGGPELIPGVSEAVVGMVVGEKKTVEIAPERGYGVHDERMVARVPAEHLPEGVELGALLQVQTPDGPVQVVLKDIEDDEAVLDGNHPLAGKVLVFDIELVEILTRS